MSGPQPNQTNRTHPLLPSTLSISISDCLNSFHFDFLFTGDPAWSAQPSQLSVPEWTRPGARSFLSGAFYALQMKSPWQPCLLVVRAWSKSTANSRGLLCQEILSPPGWNKGHKRFLWGGTDGSQTIQTKLALKNYLCLTDRVSSDLEMDKNYTNKHTNAVWQQRYNMKVVITPYLGPDRRPLDLKFEREFRQIFKRTILGSHTK